MVLYSRDTNEAFYKPMQQALAELKRDGEYRNEYTQFVDAMSYADDNEKIGFESALDSFECLVSLFK